MCSLAAHSVLLSLNDQYNSRMDSLKKRIVSQHRNGWNFLLMLNTMQLIIGNAVVMAGG